MKDRNFPTIVCLCGSTRFKKQFMESNKQETFLGKIVLSVGAFVRADNPDGSPEETLGEDVKSKLDVLHFRKIDLADEILVLNVGGYIGESTRREINYARSIGRTVRYLEEDE